MAVVAILGVLAALIVPRVVGHHDDAKRAACFANQGDIELQVKLWRRNNGSYPAANLSNIGANTAYFPERPAHLPGRRHSLHNRYNHWTRYRPYPLRGCRLEKISVRSQPVSFHVTYAFINNLPENHRPIRQATVDFRARHELPVRSEQA